MTPRWVLVIFLCCSAAFGLCVIKMMSEPSPGEVRVPVSNDFLTAPTRMSMPPVKVDKVITTPGSTRSYIALSMKGWPTRESMETVLLSLDAFEKHFDVKVVPGGWNLVWRPASYGSGYSDGLIFGICVDHDRPIDTSKPFELPSEAPEINNAGRRGGR